MTTVAELISTTYTQFLAGTLREARTQLANTIDDITENVTLTTETNTVNEGSMLSVGIEDMRVLSKNGTSLTVQRGDLGTTAAAHTAGDDIYINSKFRASQMLLGFRQELEALTGRGMYQIKQQRLRFVSSRRQYDMSMIDPDDFLEPWRAAYETTDASHLYPWIRSFEIQRDMPMPGDVTDDAGTPINKTFPTGFTLILHEGGITGRAIILWYRARYDVSLLVDESSVIEDTGLHTEATDILATGTALRLLPAREISRNLHETQGPTRRAEEVPPQAETQAMGGLFALYNRRVNEEIKRLARYYPKYENFTSPMLNMAPSAGWGFGT